MKRNFEKNLQGHNAKIHGNKARVLPGVGVLHRHLLQALSRRSYRVTRRSAHLASSTAGHNAEKALAVVQHESLLMFRGRPFEVPHGCTTKEAKLQAKAELGEAVMEMIVKIKPRRYVERARRRRFGCS